MLYYVLTAGCAERKYQIHYLRNLFQEVMKFTHEDSLNVVASHVSRSESVFLRLYEFVSLYLLLVVFIYGELYFWIGSFIVFSIFSVMSGILRKLLVTHPHVKAIF